MTESREKQTRVLDYDLSELLPSGTRRFKGLKRLGIESVRDLINFYPFRYNDFSRVVPIDRVIIGQNATILGTIHDIKIKRPRRNLAIIEVSVVDDTGVVVVSWFNQPWLQKTLKIGERIIIKGKVEHNYGFFRMASPLHTILDDEDVGGGIMPVYHANSDITRGWVARSISGALKRMPAVLDPLPVGMRIEHDLISRCAALKAIHNPEDEAARLKARRRLAFEEILLLQLHMMAKRRTEQRNVTAKRHNVGGRTALALKKALPFTLTSEQDGALSEILDDMHSDSVMNRLLLGDVGSGKTVVAASALAAVHDSGFQGVMMAPTEVLAEQYAQKLGPLFDAVGIPWALLTSSTKAAERRNTIEAAASGRLSVLFGTHALLEPDLTCTNLSLVIIDEQHRFGVDQRRSLLAKGSGVDFLSMTATPIPRSLALTIYGDMQTSYIRAKPRTDTITTTKIVNRSDIRFAYEAITEAIGRGEQAYIVCPLISAPGVTKKTEARDKTEEIEEQEIESIEDLLTEFSSEDDGERIKAAEQEVAYLRDIVFSERRVELMTSKLKAVEKRRVMDDFRAGVIDILVSTTVVEVGVDVPNATVMVIQDADRFGLSQLHQLRGRVGRGDRDGAVYLVTGTKNEDSLTRLRVMEKSNDGFELAEYDLKLRREGDILGSRQHGIQTLRLVNVIQDADLIQKAHTLAASILDEDPDFAKPEHRHLGYELKTLFGESDD